MCSVSHKLFVQAILVFSKNDSTTFYVDCIPYVPTIHVHVNCTSLEKKSCKSGCTLFTRKWVQYLKSKIFYTCCKYLIIFTGY
jgi:hypothetical protein